ncbi:MULTISPECIES: hypothetical protein [Bradyrhizobium]|uniref:hypothetical protein n=1 Tax=Bradyrhizobium TaxID=374 RepID=UPI000481FAA3|nr:MULTISPECIES: hypothetical protein [Bradyrhizobium]UFW45387.1 hypothetical protein BaraCB756_23960 [Bradyrhizobium arachidis]
MSTYKKCQTRFQVGSSLEVGHQRYEASWPGSMSQMILRKRWDLDQRSGHSQQCLLFQSLPIRQELAQRDVR